MSKQDLIKKAQELGIDNADALTVDQLTQAIKRVKLIKEATSLGLEFNPEEDTEVIAELVKAAKAEAEAEAKAKAEAEAKAKAEAKKEAGAKAESKAKAGKKKSNGKKADKELIYKHTDGRQFVWDERTPEKFRFNNVIKTKEEWMEDEEAMEMMIEGNLHWLKLKID